MTDTQKDVLLVDQLAKITGHRFENAFRLERALTHASYEPKRNAKKAAQNYERLEFLGDRVLGLCVAEMLFLSLPNATLGVRGKRRRSVGDCVHCICVISFCMFEAMYKHLWMQVFESRSKCASLMQVAVVFRTSIRCFLV